MANYTDEFAIPSIASPNASTLFTSVLVVIASLLVLEQTVYRLKKKCDLSSPSGSHLPGVSNDHLCMELGICPATRSPNPSSADSPTV